MTRTYSSLLFALATLFGWVGPASAATLVVTNAGDKGPGSLRATINDAKDGDTVVFAPGLNGQTITLTSDQITIKNSIDIEGPGASLLAISGNGVNRVFNIGEGLTVTIADLTIRNGRATGGGGILNVGSALTIANAVLSYNVSPSSQFHEPNGGAIRNSLGGNLVVMNSSFVGNTTFGGANHGDTGGGGIFNDPKSSATVTGCAFLGNHSFGGDGGVLPGKISTAGFFGHSEGGGIHNDGVCTVMDCTFTGNEATGGSRGVVTASGLSYVDFGSGGAIHNDGTVSVTNTSFTSNRAVGGSNGAAGGSTGSEFGSGYGGALTNTSSATITDCTFTGNEAQGGSGNSCAGIRFAGVGIGGAVDNFYSAATLTVNSCRFTNNSAVGGDANSGADFSGTGVGGGFANQEGATATASGSTFAGNQAKGGTGATGGAGEDGLGGGIANVLGAPLTVLSCAITSNLAAGGAGASSGNGVGGGAYFGVQGTACLDALTSITGNVASTSNSDVFGVFTTCP